MSYNLGTAEGTIALNYTGAGAAKKAKDDVDGIGKISVSTGEALHKVGNVTGIAGAAIAAGIGLAAKSAANFEARMSAVKAVSGASQKEMDQLSKKALQLGKDTSFSASEAAQAIEELVKAGVSVPDVMNGAADATVALAAAGEISLPEAATIASNAMNQFALAAEDMPHIADLIAGAANASAIDVKQFGYSLSQAGAVANLVGASFDDTATAIALLGNAGIVGSDAGTSLKTMLSNLQPQTKKQTELMKELGLITKDGTNIFFDAEGKLSDLGDVAGILNRALQGMTAAQKQATLSTLFGSDAVRAAAVFANQGAVGFTKMSQAITKVKAADVAKTRLDNFKGSLEQLKGSLETAGIVIGQIVLPALRKLVDFVAKVVNAFLGLPKGTQKAILIFVAVAGAMLLTVAAIVKVSLAVQTAIPVIKALGLALKASFLTNPVFLVIAAIVALVVLLVVAYKKSETFRKIVNGVWNSIKTVIGAVVEWLTGTAWPAIQKVWDGIVTGITATKNGLVKAWDAITNAISTAINFVKTIVTSGVEGIKSTFTAVWGAISGAATAAFKFVASVISTYINIWKTIISAVLGVIMGIWRAFWGVFGGVITAAFNLIVQVIKLGVAIWMLVINTTIKAIQAVIKVVWDAIVSYFVGVFNTIKSLFETVWGAISKALIATWNFIKSISITVWNAVKNAIITAFNAVKGPVIAVANAVKSALTTAWNFIKTISITVWNAIRSAVITAINAVKGPVTTAVNAVKGAVSTAWNAVKTATSSVWNTLSGIVGTAIGKVLGVVNSVQGKIAAVFKGAGKWLWNAGRDIIQGLLSGIESLINTVTDKLKWLTDKIPKVKGPESRDKALLRPAGKWIMEGFIDELDKGIIASLMKLSDATDMIPTTIASRSTTEIMPATGLPTRIVTPKTPASAAPPVAGPTINLEVYNPIGKPVVEELSEQATRLAVLGVL